MNSNNPNSNNSNLPSSPTNRHRTTGGLDESFLSTLDPKIADHLKNKQGNKPRALRFTWSFKTTSSMDPILIVQEILKVSVISYIFFAPRPFSESESDKQTLI